MQSPQHCSFYEARYRDYWSWQMGSPPSPSLFMLFDICQTFSEFFYILVLS